MFDQTLIRELTADYFDRLQGVWECSQTVSECLIYLPNQKLKLRRKQKIIKINAN